MIMALLRYFWEVIMLGITILAFTSVMYPLLVLVLLAGEARSGR